MAGACDSVKRLLSPYADDQLSGSDRAAVEKHLKDCPSCQARLADLKATSAVLGAYLQANADQADFSGFTNRVMQQIRKEPLPLMQRLRLKWAELMAYNSRAIYAGLGAAVAAGVAVVLVQSGSRSPMPDNQLVVHQLTVSDPRYAPVVMHTDDGESVIMLVDQQDDGGTKAPPQNPAAMPGQVTPPPHGGNL